MGWPDFWATVLPPVAAALGAIVTAAAWTAVAYLKNMRDKFEESKDREALHSALSTGIQYALEADPASTDKELVAKTARYVLDQGAPDAAKAFGLTASDLTRLVASKLSEERSRRSPDKPC